jgi:hypothetical protein
MAARRTPSARAARMVVVFRSKGSSETADVRTTRASPTRIVRRGRRACAALRRRTTVRTFARREAIASSTRTAVQAGIARPRRAATESPSTIATRHRTHALTTRTAPPATRKQSLAQSRKTARMTRRRSTGRAARRFAARRDAVSRILGTGQPSSLRKAHDEAGLVAPVNGAFIYRDRDRARVVREDDGRPPASVSRSCPTHRDEAMVTLPGLGRGVTGPALSWSCIGKHHVQGRFLS